MIGGNGKRSCTGFLHNTLYGCMCVKSGHWSYSIHSEQNILNNILNQECTYTLGLQTNTLSHNFCLISIFLQSLGSAYMAFLEIINTQVDLNSIH